MIKKNILGLSLFLSTFYLSEVQAESPAYAVQDNITVYQSKRPDSRLFVSQTVDNEIDRVSKMLKNKKLAWMFSNCLPNTLDTTIHYRTQDGEDDTFVYTGDIHAMWLRDSGAQVWPYLRFAQQDKKLQKMLKGVIRRQIKCILFDPYANAFNDGPTGGYWMSDNTKMKPELHERKWEIDSLCYPIRLAYEYWKVTGDTSVFDDKWIKAVTSILQTFKEQQRKNGLGPYSFMRKTERASDTMLNGGYGHPVKPVGLIASAFRPSDDATTFLFLVPSNFFAVTSLKKAAEIAAHLSADIKKVAVTVSLEPAFVKEIETLGFDILQVHGTLKTEVKEMTALPIWRAVNISDTDTLEELFAGNRESIEGYVADGAGYGGGKPFDWEVCSSRVRALSKGKKLILAGGLDAENVRTGIRYFHPDVVDVSSSVEEDGKKSRQKIEEFIRKVRKDEQ